MRYALSRCCGAALALVGLLASSPAPAQSLQPPENAQHQGENGQPTRRDAAPVQWSFAYNSDANADLSGGERTGSAYLQRLGLIGDADLDRLIGWHGATVHISVHSIAGRGLSATRTGNILTVSGLEAEPALRLFNLWIEQKLGARATLRAGQFTAGQEFAISPTANLFVNATFGWPGSFAADLPSGGPAYPLAAPGIRLAVQADDRTMIRAAIFPGDPAGKGTGDPQRRDLHGINSLRLKGKPFAIAEIQRSSGGDDPSWTATLGGWVHFDSFDDLRLDDTGRSLASAMSSGRPLRHARNGALYAITDWRLWRSGTRSVHGFLRGSASPADRNAIDLYVDAGLSMTSPLRGRPKDVVGVGFAIAHLSAGLRALGDQRAAFVPGRTSTPGFEGVVEGSYQMQLRPGVSVQPNVQMILHPAGALLTGAGTPPLPRRAIVLGLRTSLRL